MTDRVVRTCQPQTIEDELESLWREVSSRAPVVRTIMSNLVVFGVSLVETAALDSQIADVARQHPSRVILLIHEDRPDRGAAPVGASVALLLFEADGRCRAVEQITIRAACAQMSLPSIVRRLLVGDLPTSVWWTEDFSQTPVVAPLVAMGRHFVFDSRQWRDVAGGLSALTAILDTVDAPEPVDINWRSLRPIRQVLTTALRQWRPATSDAAVQVRIRHQPDDAARAWLLAGWLGSPDGPLGTRRSETSVAQRDGRHPLAVGIECGGASVSVEMDAVKVVADEPDIAAAPACVQVPAESSADAVAAALRVLGRDTALVAAIREAHKRLSAAASPSTDRSRP